MIDSMDEDGPSNKKQRRMMNKKKTRKVEDIKAEENELAGIDIEEVGGYKNAWVKHFLYPRMFIIKSDGTGVEIMTRE